MRTIHKEITKEQYFNATENHNYAGIFSAKEICGYGVYGEHFFKHEDKYFVTYQLGDSCD